MIRNTIKEQVEHEKAEQERDATPKRRTTTTQGQNKGARAAGNKNENNKNHVNKNKNSRTTITKQVMRQVAEDDNERGQRERDTPTLTRNIYTAPQNRE